MLEINTIQDFLNLPSPTRDEIQKAIKTKDRLEQFLKAQNKRVGKEVAKITPHWEQCRRCKEWGQPGWTWVENEKERDDSDIHPSQINRCLKFLYYSCTGKADQLEKFIDPRLQMIFDIGHAWHRTVQRYGQLGAWCSPEFYHPEVEIDPDAMTFDGQPVLPIANYYWIRGSADARIDKYVIDNVPGLGSVSLRLIHEYKTINSGQYSKLNRPKPEHKFQATIYAAVFDIPIVVYLYTNKDDCKTADFPVPFDHTIWNEVVEKIKAVQHYANADNDPPWELTSAIKNPAECEDCGFRKLCSPPLKLSKRPK